MADSPLPDMQDPGIGFGGDDAVSNALLRPSGQTTTVTYGQPPKDKRTQAEKLAAMQQELELKGVSADAVAKWQEKRRDAQLQFQKRVFDEVTWPRFTRLKDLQDQRERSYAAARSQIDLTKMLAVADNDRMVSTLQPQALAKFQQVQLDGLETIQKRSAMISQAKGTAFRQTLLQVSAALRDPEVQKELQALDAQVRPGAAKEPPPLGSRDAAGVAEWYKRPLRPSSMSFPDSYTPEPEQAAAAAAAPQAAAEKFRALLLRQVNLGPGEAALKAILDGDHDGLSRMGTLQIAAGKAAYSAAVMVYNELAKGQPVQFKPETVAFLNKELGLDGDDKNAIRSEEMQAALADLSGSIHLPSAKYIASTLLRDGGWSLSVPLQSDAVAEYSKMYLQSGMAQYLQEGDFQNAALASRQMKRAAGGSFLAHVMQLPFGAETAKNVFSAVYMTQSAATGAAQDASTYAAQIVGTLEGNLSPEHLRELRAQNEQWRKEFGGDVSLLPLEMTTPELQKADELAAEAGRRAKTAADLTSFLGSYKQRMLEDPEAAMQEIKATLQERPEWQQVLDQKLAAPAPAAATSQPASQPTSSAAATSQPTSSAVAGGAPAVAGDAVAVPAWQQPSGVELSALESYVKSLQAREAADDAQTQAAVAQLSRPDMPQPAQEMQPVQSEPTTRHYSSNSSYPLIDWHTSKAMAERQKALLQLVQPAPTPPPPQQMQQLGVQPQQPQAAAYRPQQQPATTQPVTPQFAPPQAAPAVPRYRDR